MAHASCPPHYSLLGDTLLQFPHSSRKPRHYQLDRTFSGASLALGPTGEVYISGGKVNGHDSKTVHQWTEGLTAIGETVHVRTRHSSVFHQGNLYLVGGGMPIEQFSLEARVSKVVVDSVALYATSVCIHREEMVIFGRRLEADKRTLLHIYNFPGQKTRQIHIPKSVKALNQAVCFSLDKRSVVLCGGFKEGLANCDTLVFDSMRERWEQVRFEVDFEGYREPVSVRNNTLIAVDVTGMRHVLGLQRLQWELKKDIYGPENWATRSFALFCLHHMRGKAQKLTQRLPWLLLVEAIQLL